MLCFILLFYIIEPVLIYCVVWFIVYRFGCISLVNKKRLAKLVKVASKVIGMHLSVYSFVFNACKPDFLQNNDKVEAENYMHGWIPPDVDGKCILGI